MNKNLGIVIVALVVVVPALYASQRQNTPSPYVQGTVLEVQKQEVYSPDTVGGSNPSDATLTSRYYAYEVSIRVDCKTYVGRYETPFDYLPVAFTANQPIQVRLARHVMYFDLPAYPNMRMGIVHRSAECGQNR